MKTYFITLFNYDRYANGLILTAIIDAGEPEKPVQLMSHLLAAQQIWYNRCLGYSFEDQLSNIITHVINHGTHHRAQIGQQLKFAGVENLPITDYIFYLRQLKN